MDVVVGVGVDAIARFGGRPDLQIPGTPVRDVGVGEAGFPRCRVGGVGVGFACSRGRIQEAGGGYAGGVGQIGRDLGGVGGGYVDYAHGEVVAINERDVVEGLAVRHAATEVELGEGGGNRALYSC